MVGCNRKSSAYNKIEQEENLVANRRSSKHIESGGRSVDSSFELSGKNNTLLKHKNERKHIISTYLSKFIYSRKVTVALLRVEKQICFNLL